MIIFALEYYRRGYFKEEKKNQMSLSRLLPRCSCVTVISHPSRHLTFDL